MVSSYVVNVGDKVLVETCCDATWPVGLKGTILTKCDKDALVRFSVKESKKKGHGPKNNEWYVYYAEMSKVENPVPKKKKGDQSYKGNGNHAWEPAALNTSRLRVPGGWLYRNTSYGIAYVPMPDVVKHKV